MTDWLPCLDAFGITHDSRLLNGGERSYACRLSQATRERAECPACGAGLGVPCNTPTGINHTARRSVSIKKGVARTARLFRCKGPPRSDCIHIVYRRRGPANATVTCLDCLAARDQA